MIAFSWLNKGGKSYLPLLCIEQNKTPKLFNNLFASNSIDDMSVRKVISYVRGFTYSTPFVLTNLIS